MPQPVSAHRRIVISLLRPYLLALPLNQQGQHHHLPLFFGSSDKKKTKFVRLLPRSSSISRRFGGGFLKEKKMACSLERCDVNIEATTSSRLGVIRPATKAHAEEAIEALKAGKVIAVPTDTLYGFACDACSREAVNRIYEIKGRKHTSPLAICVGDVSDIERFAITDHLPHGLLDCLLPGPVTVVLRRGLGLGLPCCRFGTGSAVQGSNLLKTSEEQKRKARGERFDYLRGERFGSWPQQLVVKVSHTKET